MHFLLSHTIEFPVAFSSLYPHLFECAMPALTKFFSGQTQRTSSLCKDLRKPFPCLLIVFRNVSKGLLDLVKFFQIFSKKHLPNSFSYDNILLVAELKSRQTNQKLRLRGQAVKTSPFHGGNTGSIPVGVIWRRSQVVRQWSATPVSTGSNPVDASSFPETDGFRDFSIC